MLLARSTLGGSFTTAGIGTLIYTGGTVNLSGSLNNTSNTLVLSNTTGTWNLNGGTITGGTITTSGKASAGRHRGWHT